MTAIDAMRRPGAVLGWMTIIVIVAITATPVVVLAWSIVDPASEVWSELWRTRLPGMLTETAFLLVMVVAGSVLLGTALAWLVSAYSFPGRRVFGWLLVVPLAIPGYVAGFVWLDTLTGVVGPRSVRSLWLCALVLTLSLYPYVYLFARASFAGLGASTIAAARSLGAGPIRRFWTVAVPNARPAIAAGAALVAMEVLTDIGTVRLFNVSTLADGVMRVWFGSGNRDAATEVATALTFVAILVVAVERLSRRGARHARHGTGAVQSPQRLSVVGSTGAIAVGAVVVGVAAVVPIARLVAWSLDAARQGQTATVAGGIGHHVTNSLSLALTAGLVCLGTGVVLALVVVRRGRLARAGSRLATIGYAMPGPVVAVGVVVTLAAIDRGRWLPGDIILVGSVIGLVFALVVRFMAIAFQGAESGLDKVPPASVDSARLLGAGPLRVALAVEIPAVRFGLLAAAALLFVDMIKELPITLLLRPFGVDTLSVWVWQATSESLWTQAALPSLVMVAVGMVAVGALLVALDRGAEVVS